MMTQQLLKELIYYNPTMGIFVWKQRDRAHFNRDQNWKMWNTRNAGNIAGSVHTDTCGNRYIFIKIFGKQYRAHRLAYFYVMGEWPSDEIDHIDGNGTHNQWSNIRSVTLNENRKNRSTMSSNTSGVAGVSWESRCDKWRVRINVDNKRKCLGFFTDFDEAVTVRKAAEIKYNYHPNHGRVRRL